MWLVGEGVRGIVVKLFGWRVKGCLDKDREKFVFGFEVEGLF